METPLVAKQIKVLTSKQNAPTLFNHSAHSESRFDADVLIRLLIAGSTDDGSYGLLLPWPLVYGNITESGHVFRADLFMGKKPHMGGGVVQCNLRVWEHVFRGCAKNPYEMRKAMSAGGYSQCQRIETQDAFSPKVGPGIDELATEAPTKSASPTQTQDPEGDSGTHESAKPKAHANRGERMLAMKLQDLNPTHSPDMSHLSYSINTIIKKKKKKLPRTNT